MSIKKYLRQSSPGTGHLSINSYLLRRGHAYPSQALSVEESALFTDVDFTRFKLKQCYYNAQTLMMEFQDNAEVKYAEGLAANNTQVPTFHAWLSVNGKVVDPTWGRLRMEPKETLQVVRLSHIMGTLPPGWEYWGVEFSCEDVAIAMVAHKSAISILDDYECRWPVLHGKRGHVGAS